MRIETTENVTYTETEEAIMDMVAEELSVERSIVTYKSNLIEDLGADSLDLVAILLAFEEMFDHEMRDHDAEKIRTVKDIFDYCEKKKLSLTQKRYSVWG